MEVTKSVVRVRETNPLRRYKTVKKNATYKPYPDFDKLMGECDLCDGLDSTGRTDKVTHNAHTRLVVQCELFMRWYSVVFKNYHNRVERERVFELIRMFGGSVGSLLSLLDSRVEQNRSAHIPIDFPVAWCKSVVEGEVKRVLKDRLKLEKELAEIRETVTVTEVSNVPALTSPKQSSSKSAEQPRKPWDKPTPLTESVWYERYDKIAKGDLMGLNVMTLEPGKEGDVFCTGDRDKDVLERCNIRNRSTSVFSRSPIEQEAYDRRHASLDKSARESARKAGVYDMIYGKEEPTEQETMEPKKPIKEPEKPTDETVKPLPEYVWKENYRITTKDEFMQTSETLKGMSVLTLSPAFLRGEVACTGDYNTDYKAFCADVRSFTDAMQAEFKARMSNPVR